MFEAMTQTIAIEGAGYHTAALSGSARMQVMNPRVTDREIARLKRQSAIYPTARTACASTLKEALPGKTVH